MRFGSFLYLTLDYHPVDDFSPALRVDQLASPQQFLLARIFLAFRCFVRFGANFCVLRLL